MKTLTFSFGLPGTRAKQLQIILCILLTFGLNAQSWQWVSQSHQSTNTINGAKICVDKFGNVFVQGDSWGNAKLGNNSISPGHFIAKYTSDGQLVWAKNIGQESAWIDGMWVDNLGGFYLIDLPESSYMTLRLSRYDTNGKVIWTRSGAGPVTDAVCDEFGNLYMANRGQSGDTAIFNQTKFFLPQESWSSFLIQSVNPDGNLRWQSRGVQLSDSGFLQPIQIELNYKNQLVVLVNGIFPHGGNSAIAYFTFDGQLQNYFPGPELDFHNGYPELAVDRNNKIYVLSYQMLQTGIKYDEKFNEIRKFGLNTDGHAWRNMLRFGPSNKMHLAASYSDSNPLYDYCGISVPSRSGQNSGIHIFKDDVNCDAFFTSEGNGIDYINSYAIGEDGSVYVTGSFRNTSEGSTGPSLSFGGHSMANEGSHEDMFVYKLSGLSLGLNDYFADKTQLSVFPNPASGFITVPGADANTVAEFYAVCGEKVCELISDENGRYNISQLAPGAYLIKYSGNNSVGSAWVLVALR